MTLTQEIVTTLFLPDVIQQAKKQVKAGVESSDAERYDIPFRLFRVDNETVNLEISMRRMYGVPRTGPMGMVQDMAMYFKPVGVYKISPDSNKVTITILKEFEEDYHLLKRNNAINGEHEVKMFTLKENAVITAFSMDVYVEAKAKKDDAFFRNGFDIEIIMTVEPDSYPQIFMHDKYNLNGPIGAYFAQGPYSLNPTFEYKRIFDDFKIKGLLSALKGF